MVPPSEALIGQERHYTSTKLKVHFQTHLDRFVEINVNR